MIGMGLLFGASRIWRFAHLALCASALRVLGALHFGRFALARSP
jgi:hypothetical protein